MKRNQVLKIWVLGVFGMALLGVASADEKAPEVVGKYKLEKVDGKKVPAEITHGEMKLLVRSGEFEIKADKTCVSTVVFGPVSGEPVTRIVKATYVQEGKKLKMKWEKAGRTEGTVEGEVFTMDNHGTVFSYRRVAEKKE